MIEVRAFRNETALTRDSWRVSYQPGDQLTEYTARVEPYLEETTTDGAILERTFRVLNAVDGWEPVCETGERSLSMGDVVEIRRRLMDGWLIMRYVCQGIGWSRLDLEERVERVSRNGNS